MKRKHILQMCKIVKSRIGYLGVYNLTLDERADLLRSINNELLKEESDKDETIGDRAREAYGFSY